MIPSAYINAYNDYLSTPDYKRMSTQNELYENGWIILTGRSIVSPHPHRKYTLEEFVFQCSKDDDLKNRFVKIEDLRDDKINEITNDKS